MKATIKYFGWIAEAKGQSSEVLDHDFLDLDALTHYIHHQAPALTASNYRVSLNLSMSPTDKTLKEGDEIAFLPPFSGG